MKWHDRIRILSEECQPHRYHSAQYSVVWHGFMYMDGCRCAEKTVECLLMDFAPDRLPEAVNRLKGVFFAAIHDNSAGQTYCFIDNSGLYRAFAAFGIISNSLLALVDRCGVEDIDFSRLVEFLVYDGVFSTESLLKPVTKLVASDIIVYSDQGDLIRLKKKLPHISDPSPACLTDQIDQLFSSISGRSISFDITGGTDSRLLVCLAESWGLNYSLAISGGKDCRDRVIAAQIAGLLGRPLIAAEQFLTDDFESEIGSIFSIGTGMLDAVGYH